MSESTFMKVQLQIQQRVSDGMWRAAVILNDKPFAASKWFATHAEAEAEADRLGAGLREQLPKEGAKWGAEIIFHERDPRN